MDNLLKMYALLFQNKLKYKISKIIGQFTNSLIFFNMERNFLYVHWNIYNIKLRWQTKIVGFNEFVDVD